MTTLPPNSPFFHRLALRFGRPFGLRWVGDFERAVIYRMESYDTLKGPGFFGINPTTQRIHDVVSIMPDLITTTLPNIQTRDAIQLDFPVAIRYAPILDQAPREVAAIAVRLSPDVRRGIVTFNAQRALQAVLPLFNAEQVCRGQVYDAIEQRWLPILREMLAEYALEPKRVRVLPVILPPTLKDRFEAVTQRTVDAQDLSQYTSFELARVLRVQVLEAMKEMSPNRQYIEFSDPMKMMDFSSEQRPPIQISQTPMPPPPSHSHSSPADDTGAGGSARSASPPAPPPASTSPKKRPKSRLG